MPDPTPIDAAADKIKGRVTPVQIAFLICATLYAIWTWGGPADYWQAKAEQERKITSVITNATVTLQGRP